MSGVGAEQDEIRRFCPVSLVINRYHALFIISYNKVPAMQLSTSSLIPNSGVPFLSKYTQKYKGFNLTTFPTKPFRSYLTMSRTTNTLVLLRSIQQLQRYFNILTSMSTVIDIHLQCCQTCIKVTTLPKYHQTPHWYLHNYLFSDKRKSALYRIAIILLKNYCPIPILLLTDVVMLHFDTTAKISIMYREPNQ